MKCKGCNGTGEAEYTNGIFSWKSTCHDCQGKGYIEPLTNEEWFCGLSTEEKARFLDKICYSAWGDRNSRFKDMADYTDWLEWLKEVHNG